MTDVSFVKAKNGRNVHFVLTTLPLVWYHPDVLRCRHTYLPAGELSTSANFEALKLKYKEIGSIKIEVWRYKELLHKSDYTRADQKKALEPIPEKILKGKAISVASGSVTNPHILHGANLPATDLVKPKRLVHGAIAMDEDSTPAP